jgi:hypothetical protein
LLILLLTLALLLSSVAAVAVLVIGATLKNGISIVLAFLTFGPFFERFFILGGPRGTRQKTFKIETERSYICSSFCPYFEFAAGASVLKQC